MIKEKRFSAHHDFKTGFFFKLSLILGIFLLAVFFFVKTIVFFISENSQGFLKNLYDFSNSGQSESIAAFSLLLIALSVIIYAFNYQLCKLSKIAEDIENNEDCE